MERQDADRLAMTLASAYPGRGIGQLHIDSWLEQLQAWDLPVGEKAIAQLRQNVVDPPSVAQLVAALREADASLRAYRPELVEVSDEFVDVMREHLSKFWEGREEEHDSLKRRKFDA